MPEQNPYQPPQAAEVSADNSRRRTNTVAFGREDELPAVSTHDTIAARYVAASFDNLAALIAAVAIAKSLDNDYPLLQTAAAGFAYLGYFIFLEGLTARTLGKLITGLVVVQFDGSPITWRQTLIRNLFRVLEVNPFLLGALPAALAVFFSRHHQRFGDKAAGVIVVKRRRLRSRV
jgi:uncharacterized RDD family membrane protein YckC